MESKLLIHTAVSRPLDPSNPDSPSSCSPDISEELVDLNGLNNERSEG